MTTGEKLAVLRKKKELTQEQLAEILNVSRQSVSRWEMDAAFPETEKLIKLSKLMECSIDYLLNDDMQDNGEVDPGLSVQDCVKFIRECGYFFLATAFEEKPKLRPMGMIYSDDKALYIATDKRKNVYTDLTNNPQVELAGYNLNTRKWIRISGRMQVESSIKVKEDMMLVYPMIKQEYIGEEEVYLAIFKLVIDNVTIY
ncbi:MAG: pyridoxamine 5'-phosphate oxidase family protein [Lachnospiraceae bacterium]|nr:pyridoxamine 5'-phosphate oxidase family protein [Lachnospiraceae bacterium]